MTIAPKLGTHLKLRMGNPYPNELNPHGQLSLIAINLLGEEFNSGTENIQMKTSNNIEQLENSIASICDDLSFSMYVEESVADVVREMEIRKTKAVHGESISLYFKQNPL